MAKPPKRSPFADVSSARVALADRTAALPLPLRLHPAADPAAWRAAGGAPSCTGCVAHCCRYVAVEIDRPRTKWQYDQIHWMLHHESVSVYVDRRGDWFAEFRTRCRQLTDASLCAVYAERPMLCKEYEAKTCPVWNERDLHRLRFATAESFAAYLEQSGIDWRYRNGGPARAGARTLIRRPRRRTPGPARSGGAGRARGRSPRA